MKKYSILFLISCLVLFAKDKSEGETTVMRTGDGVMVVFNSNASNEKEDKKATDTTKKPKNYVEHIPTTSFRFNIPCNNFRDVESENLMFMADEIVFQFLPVPILSFADTALAINDNDSIVLLHHQYSELVFTRKSIPGEYKISDNMFRTSEGRLCLFWEFEMPGKYKDKDTSESVVHHHMYVTTRFNEKVLMFSSPVQWRNNPEEVKGLLKAAISTIYIKDGLFSVEAIQDSLQNEFNK